MTPPAPQGRGTTGGSYAHDQARFRTRRQRRSHVLRVVLGILAGAALGSAMVLTTGAEGPRVPLALGLGALAGGLGGWVIVVQRLGILGALLTSQATLAGPYLLFLHLDWLRTDPGHLFAGLLLGLVGSAAWYLSGWTHDQPGNG